MAKRRANDAYYTPASLTRALLWEEPTIGGIVYEPCVGEGHISSVLMKAPTVETVHVNDIAFTGVDSGTTWLDFPKHPHWVITNPPFNQAEKMLPFWWDRVDAMACLLRLSYLEPTKGRGEWLKANPPQRMYVMPRISFTGDGKSDSVTCAWMVWDRTGNRNESFIKVVTREELALYDRFWETSNFFPTTVH